MIQLPDGASKQRTDAVLSKVERYFLSIPAIHSTDALSGLNFVFNTRGPNAATMFLPLHHWDRRGPHEHVKAIIGAAYGEFSKIPEALILAFNALPSGDSAPRGAFPCNCKTPAAETSTRLPPAVKNFSLKL